MERDNDGSTPTRPCATGGRGAVVSDLTSAGSIQPDPSTAVPSTEPSSLVDELFSILSHELRAPLTTIKGSSRTLLRHGAALESATARQLLQDIDQEADRLHRLVDNLLELARAGVGTSALRTEPTPVDVLLRRVVADATPRAGDRRLRVRAPLDLPRPAIDPVRIEQVIRNLVDNAVKFSPSSGTIDISAARHGSEIVVTVKDDGPGVAPEYQDRVFERFFRVEREGSNVAGAGLGLAICKRFVELHGGRIELESRPGQGAAFRFTLPLGERSAMGASSSVSAPVSESAP
jgi:two-component system, OmpR family, sensor histidine kinase KdpD